MNIVTIIIPVFNNFAYTKGCIESIYKNTEIDNFKLIIIDNASVDETPAFLENLKSRYKNFQYIRNEINLGFAKANNQAAKIADTDKVLFLNNDTVVTPNWLTILTGELDADENVKIAGSKLLYEDSSIQHAGMVFSDFKYDDFNIIYHLYRFFPDEHPAVNKKRYFQALTGACLLTYTSFFLKLGGFNENYINGFEDVDLCLKARESGAELLYCPESVIYHFEGKTAGRFNKTGENTNLFYSLWKDKILPDDENYYLEDGFTLNKVAREWKPVEGGKLRQEFLDIVFEKCFDNPGILIIINEEGTELKNFIQELNINTNKSFKLFLVSQNNSCYDFRNLSVINKNNFNISDMESIIRENKINNVALLSSDKNYTFNWDKTFNFLQKEEFLNQIEKFNSGKVEKNDLLLLESLQKFFPNDNSLLLILSQCLQLNNNHPQAIEILNRILKLKGKDEKVISLMIKSLEILGDNNTASKLKNLL